MSIPALSADSSKRVSIVFDRYAARGTSVSLAFWLDTEREFLVVVYCDKVASVVIIGKQAAI
jgi:hypothetical protein